MRLVIAAELSDWEVWDFWSVKSRITCSDANQQKDTVANDRILGASGFRLKSACSEGLLPEKLTQLTPQKRPVSLAKAGLWEHSQNMVNRDVQRYRNASVCDKLSPSKMPSPT